jgi:hypothetical protein
MEVYSLNAKAKFIIPVGKSPVPILRIAITVIDEYLPVLIYNSGTKETADDVKNYLNSKGHIVEMVCLVDESISSIDEVNIFSLHKADLNKVIGENTQMLFGTGAKWFCTSIALANELKNMWIIEEKRTSNNNQIGDQFLRQLNGPKARLKLVKIELDEIFPLIGLLECEIGNWKSTRHQKPLPSKIELSIESNSQKILIKLKLPKGYRDWTINTDKDVKKIKGKIRKWEGCINKTKSEWVDAFGSHSLKFVLPEIQCNEKKLRGIWKSQIDRIKNSGKWYGGGIT